MDGPVVMALDSSREVPAVVDCAAREADRRGVALRFTQAIAWPTGRNTGRRAALGPGQARTAREGRSATGGIAESPCGRTEGRNHSRGPLG
jgi:hypothetical protein